ncbi:hypothetical protein BaRGS_00014379 [Batillaria attramentaria]|uniref:Uncharacterized protein n=1 Tax=Batillaria attramentaria TaxID=370345 RepID=A0ABD0L5W9_9CAEN
MKTLYCHPCSSCVHKTLSLPSEKDTLTMGLTSPSTSCRCSYVGMGFINQRKKPPSPSRLPGSEASRVNVVAFHSESATVSPQPATAGH